MLWRREKALSLSAASLILLDSANSTLNSAAISLHTVNSHLTCTSSLSWPEACRRRRRFIHDAPWTGSLSHSVAALSPLAHFVYHRSATSTTEEGRKSRAISPPLVSPAPLSGLFLSFLVSKRKYSITVATPAATLVSQGRVAHLHFALHNAIHAGPRNVPLIDRFDPRSA